MKQTIGRNEAKYFTDAVLIHFLKEKFPNVEEKDFKLENFNHLWSFTVPELVDEADINDWIEEVKEKGWDKKFP
ncbi:hypothetical protein MMC10_000367 [Thelotrema lepadinum]|nr:hypothetical protein [Thelotrema lepadinum]